MILTAPALSACTTIIAGAFITGLPLVTPAPCARAGVLLTAAPTMSGLPAGTASGSESRTGLTIETIGAAICRASLLSRDHHGTQRGSEKPTRRAQEYARLKERRKTLPALAGRVVTIVPTSRNGARIYDNLLTLDHLSPRRPVNRGPAY